LAATAFSHSSLRYNSLLWAAACLFTVAMVTVFTAPSLVWLILSSSYNYAWNLAPS